MESVLSAEAEYLMREAKRINESLDKFVLEGEFCLRMQKVEFVYDELGNEHGAIVPWRRRPKVVHVSTKESSRV